ncbi:L-seryl-tRNA(Sec) kinase isoform X2 [Puntigrus tetrazona]|uniref:L-seryl-tRNA(Sec) kinase isoform X2 n=1 Tax=Puntigrus tetrazona TaxID=1606681 RepID=UPI001C8A68A9|nr:L-seryl-tRNA(Sec) kinase isoform X2 [Puntigrus tetrazona]
MNDAAALCVLSGLPAAGKSRLARELRGRAWARGWRTLLVTYDELIPARDWRQSEWKQHRKMVLMCLERFLHHPSDQTRTLSDQTQTPSDQTQTLSEVNGVWMRFEQMRQQQSISHTHTHSQPLVVLLDDNFYYQSMRYQVQQLARKYGVGFCQVFLQCPLHVCLQRNRSRPQPVPDDVLLQMCERMEPPNEIRNPWEQQSLTLDSTDGIADGHVQKLMDLLASALENPRSPVQDETQQKEADRLICASSVLHRADQTCRRLVSQALSSAREGQASPDEQKALAKALTELKTAFLQELKKDVLHRVSVFPDEPVDVEQLLMNVSAAFQRRSREIVCKRLTDSG